MRASPWAPFVVITGVVIGAACADSATMPGPGDLVALLSPASGAQITQNDPTIGCPYDPESGHGFRLAFDWEDVEGADKYFVRLQRTGSLYPVIHDVIGSSELESVHCQSFVLDRNLTGWVWRVAAVANGDDTLHTDTLWSETRTYEFLPCRLTGDVHCYAPQDTTMEPQWPLDGALLEQNDPATGCIAHPTRGYGFRLAFDWEDVAGADRYLVRFKRNGAPYAVIEHSTTESTFNGLFCNAFVIDQNLSNWVWRVSALANGADSLATDTLWTEVRNYGFKPCRLASGVACFAGVDTVPPSDSLR
jgi:hypothetical protein